MKSYVLDAYNEYDSNKTVKYIFRLFGKLYCIRMVEEFEWGRPLVREHMLEEGSENDSYAIYSSYEAAYKKAQELKKVERGF